MLNDLVYFDNSIVGRYRTVERNIKSKSNSFYDSFLDLLENTIKRILVLENVPYDEKFTCGTLLREESIEKFFKEEIGVDDYTYSKCKDYIAKVNRHKHFNEHMINIDTVVTYVKVYYNLVSDYLKYKGKEVSPFNADYYNSIYGLTEKENKELKNEVGRLRDDLETLTLENKLSTEDNEIYRALISAQEMEKLSLEDQNNELKSQISKLKDIKINAIEVKLNKALELLYNITDSVVESRAIGIAVGKTIIGKDITETDYMKDAVEIVKKKDSIYDKLDRQDENITRLSSQFSDMQIEDLYKAAFDSFKNINYESAKKYYEHAGLLKPLDWRPQFYIGLCSILGKTYSYYKYFYECVHGCISFFNTTIRKIDEQSVDTKTMYKDYDEIFNVLFKRLDRCWENLNDALADESAELMKKDYILCFLTLEEDIVETFSVVDSLNNINDKDERLKYIANFFADAYEFTLYKCRGTKIGKDAFYKIISISNKTSFVYSTVSNDFLETIGDDGKPIERNNKKKLWRR